MAPISLADRLLTREKCNHNVWCREVFYQAFRPTCSQPSRMAREIVWRSAGAMAPANWSRLWRETSWGLLKQPDKHRSSKRHKARSPGLEQPGCVAVLPP